MTGGGKERERERDGREGARGGREDVSFPETLIFLVGNQIESPDGGCRLDGRVPGVFYDRPLQSDRWARAPGAMMTIIMRMSFPAYCLWYLLIKFPLSDPSFFFFLKEPPV